MRSYVREVRPRIRAWYGWYKFIVLQREGADALKIEDCSW